MTAPERIVLSASRRTDIPAFYLDWFMDGIRRGRFEVVHPYTHRQRQVTVSSERIHTIVLWSKDFGPFLRRQIGERLERRGFHLFFNFTVNSRDLRLEPHVVALEERLEQMAELARRFSPEAIHWRFDPICYYRTADGRLHDNRHDFEQIADAAAAVRIGRCVTSFVDLYAKVQRRAGRLGICFEDPPLAEKSAILQAMAAALAPRGISLETCCEAEALALLPPESPVRPGACVPAERLMALYGGRVSLSHDTGQRRRAGCQCRISVDIGSYDLHPCGHDCLFCYARPSGGLGPGDK